MSDRIYKTVPSTYDDLAVTRKQHDRMVAHLGRPLTWPIDHTAQSRTISIDPMTYLTQVLRHEWSAR